MSNVSRFTLMLLALATTAAYAAEPPATGTLSKEATAAGPAVNTSATSAPAAAPSATPGAPASQESTTPRRANSTAPQAGSQAANRPGNDRLNLDTTVVTGNRELPKVLYIVPWKKSDLGELPAQPFNTLLDEALTPVDRDVFRREVTYYGAINAGPDAAPQQAERSEK